MKKVIQNIFKVKSLMSLACIGLLWYCTVTGKIEGSDAFSVILMVFTYYFNKKDEDDSPPPSYTESEEIPK